MNRVTSRAEEEMTQMSNRTPGITPLRTLVEGQRLDQPTFHALYQAMPPETRAELINGVVYLPGPIGPAHGRAQIPAIVWLGEYAENTLGVGGLIHVTTSLGWKSELEPDALLRVLAECGGRTREEKDFLRGAPELVIEFAETTRYHDLGPKLEDYERAGVLEYIVRAIEPDEVLWFVLRKGRFVDLEPGPDGIYRSEVFPGLWLDPGALLAGDRRRLRAVVDLGCATPEHAAFVATLAAARTTP
jgi:Uma2 family endonuclease